MLTSMSGWNERGEVQDFAASLLKPIKPSQLYNTIADVDTALDVLTSIVGAR